jgi:hypothetical protein
MAVRALDYCPPVDLSFADYLAALLTADAQTVPDDKRYRYRQTIREVFASYGITAPRATTEAASGQWLAFDDSLEITYSRTHFESMLHDEEEVFRFIWENRRALGIPDLGELRVNSVRPGVRQGQDGFLVRETLCEYVQVLRIFSAELPSTLHIERPPGMGSDVPLTLYGGGTLVFDEYGRIKYHVSQRLMDGDRQALRLGYLWEHDLIGMPAAARSRFADLHRRRAL